MNDLTLKKMNFIVEDMCMTGLNFRQISPGNLALSSTKHVQDGSDIMMQGT